jgi:HK97 family phage prohead protease
MHIKKTQDTLPLAPAGRICGYASTFNTSDADNDCIRRGAFKETLKKWQASCQWPKLLWQHQTKEPIGTWRYMAEDSHGLFVEGHLTLETQRGFEAYALIKQGALTYLSIGFQLREARIDPTTKTRHIHRIDLFEVSLVTFASNQQARLTAPFMPP